MKELDYGKGYRYAHNEVDSVADMDCLPENLQQRKYYKPTSQGYEKLIGERLEEIQKRRRAAQERNKAPEES